MTMNFQQRAEDAAATLYEVLSVSPTNEQKAAAAKLIEQVIIDVLLEESSRLTDVAMECCSPDLDTAHKVAKEIRQSNAALIANLSSLR